MILLGSLLLLFGLVNSLAGIHQTASPFDVVEEETVDVSADANIKKTYRATGSGEISMTLGSEEPAPWLLHPAQIYEESDRPEGLIPDRLVIPTIDLDAPIFPTKIKEINFQGQMYYQWLAPNKRAIGWHDTSALLGLPGNTVLNGHHNVHGEVFKDLVNLHEGDQIEVYSGDQVYTYRVALAMLLPERFKSLSIRLENARWIMPTLDERLTLITCWPYQSNTHRVIIVALPMR